MRSEPEVIWMREAVVTDSDVEHHAVSLSSHRFYSGHGF